MRHHILLLSALAGLASMSTSCNQVECGEGTIERDGSCQPSDNGAMNGSCGPFTELIGDRCVPMFPPTVCEDGTTLPELDTATGVTTCKGTGGTAGCGSSLACPTPTGATKQTICGQIFNFEDNAPFAAAGAMGAKCDPAMPAAAGPCALDIRVYDALVFAANPAAATELNVGSIYIDDCGRFRVQDIEVPSGPFIGLGIDDASGLGGGGVTVTAAAAVPKQPMGATKDMEHWIANQTTIGKWVASGGPAFSMTAGIYAAVFRQHKIGNGDPFATQSGVTITKSGNTIPANDFYFTAAQTTRETIDAAATATGANGTAFVNNAVANEGLVFNGQGGLGAGCRWDPHAGASLGGIVFIQIFRKLDILGMTCND
jgi:hypothetical protein